MERWYVGLLTRRSPIELTQHIGRLVRQYSLGDFITTACYEKRSSDKRTGEYYYFMGIVSDAKGVIPDEKYHALHNVLSQLNLYDLGIYVYYDEIQSMASKELETFNFRQLKMVPLKKQVPSDPFDYSPSSTKELEPSGPTDPAFNQLLYWLSTYGRGTWEQFRSTCTELRIDLTGEQARRISRRLRLLGHIEMASHGQSWFSAPACLVHVETTDHHYHAFLAGQRSLRLVAALDREAQVSIESHPYGNAPDRVSVIFENQESIIQFATAYSQQHFPLHLVGLSGLRLASILPDLDQWERNLPTLAIVQGNYHYQRWNSSRFESVPLPKESGLYTLRHISERFDHPQLTLFYNAETELWRKADWYGLRFLALRRSGIRCDTHYDPERRELAVLHEQRWPELYERSLVLASGRLPISRNNHAIYSNISETHAQILLSKLGAHFVEQRTSDYV